MDIVQEDNNRGLYKSWAPGRRDDKILYSDAQYLGLLSIEIAL